MARKFQLVGERRDDQQHSRYAAEDAPCSLGVLLDMVPARTQTAEAMLRNQLDANILGAVHTGQQARF